jgi:transcription elongation factor Elf1
MHKKLEEFFFDPDYITCPTCGYVEHSKYIITVENTFPAYHYCSYCNRYFVVTSDYELVMDVPEFNDFMGR